MPMPTRRLIVVFERTLRYVGLLEFDCVGGSDVCAKAVAGSEYRDRQQGRSS
jgi:hypothetical protein